MNTKRNLKGGAVSDRDVKKLWDEATPEFRAWAKKVYTKTKSEVPCTWTERLMRGDPYREDGVPPIWIGPGEKPERIKQADKLSDGLSEKTRSSRNNACSPPQPASVGVATLSASPPPASIDLARDPRE